MTTHQQKSEGPIKGLRIFFERLPERFLLPYRAHRWIWHAFAAGITAVIVLTGFDWWFFEHTRNASLLPLIMLAGIGGFFVPILLPIVLYTLGRRQVDGHLLRTAVGIAQASAITWIIIAVYKTFTGRIQPEMVMALNTTDISRGFQFGFFENGIFWGWPSHHAAVAVAGATVIWLACRRSTVRIAAVVWTAIVAAGAGIGFHWFSDVVAGTIIGAVVGAAVWRDVRDA